MKKENPWSPSAMIVLYALADRVPTATAAAAAWPRGAVGLVRVD